MNAGRRRSREHLGCFVGEARFPSTYHHAFHRITGLALKRSRAVWNPGRAHFNFKVLYEKVDTFGRFAKQHAKTGTRWDSARLFAAGYKVDFEEGVEESPSPRDEKTAPEAVHRPQLTHTEWSEVKSIMCHPRRCNDYSSNHRFVLLSPITSRFVLSPRTPVTSHWNFQSYVEMYM